MEVSQNALKCVATSWRFFPTQFAEHLAFSPLSLCICRIFSVFASFHRLIRSLKFFNLYIRSPHAPFGSLVASDACLAALLPANLRGPQVPQKFSHVRVGVLNLFLGSCESRILVRHAFLDRSALSIVSKDPSQALKRSLSCSPCNFQN